MPAAFFRRIHWATAKPKRKEEIAQHKRHYRTLHCCGAVQLAVCGRVLLRGPSQRVCVVRQHDERHEHLCAADHRRDDEVRAVPEESVRVSARARSCVPTGADGKRGGAAGAVAAGSHGRGAPPPAITRTRTRAQPPLPHNVRHLARLFRLIRLLQAENRDASPREGGIRRPH